MRIANEPISWDDILEAYHEKMIAANVTGNDSLYPYVAKVEDAVDPRRQG